MGQVTLRNQNSEDQVSHELNLIGRRFDPYSLKGPQ